MTDKKFIIAVAGATGAVGNQMISCLEERNFPIKSIKFLASSRSVGRKLKFKGRDRGRRTDIKDRDIPLIQFRIMQQLQYRFSNIYKIAAAFGFQF